MTKEAKPRTIGAGIYLWVGIRIRIHLIGQVHLHVLGICFGGVSTYIHRKHRT